MNTGIVIRDRCRECPNCKGESSKVVDSRLRADGYIYRRRECTNCKTRWTTIEVPVADMKEIFNSMFGSVDG